jgi:hypothetical protein
VGKTSKPVHLLVDQAILDAAPEQWQVLKDQGHLIDNLSIALRDIEGVPIIVAPTAMRMTAAMVTDLPKAIELLIKGARALQHSPAGGEGWTKGKPKRVANKTKGTRKNSKVKAEAHGADEPPASTGTGGSEGETGGEQQAIPVGQTSYIEGNG